MTRIAFIGGGNMAFALVEGLRGAGEAFDIVVADPMPEQLARFQGVETQANNATAAAAADAIVLAVKPQALATALEQTRPSAGQLVVSIAAGARLGALAALTAANQPIVRCMPNTPALVGAGITGAVANQHVSPDQRRLAQRVLESVGEVVWFDHERHLDAVTALSGSGPAYFFLLLESLTEGGVALGLDASVARRLAVATAVGAARMAEGGDVDPAALRERVTSPGGTTERALSILDAHGAQAAFRAAMFGAWERSRELAAEFGKQTQR